MRWLVLILVSFGPMVVYAEVVQFVFTTTPQSVAPHVVSETLTVQAQTSGGTSQTIPQTGCLQLETTSPSGQFSSSATSWEALSVITMNSGTANKNFYYKGAIAGTHSITVKVGLRPAGESRTCATLLSVGEFPTIQWTATQSITIQGSGNTTTDNIETTDTSTTTGTTNTTQNTSTVNQSTPVTSYVAPPEPTLFADAGSDRVVIVGAHTEYVARAYNRKKELVGNASFRWNFGDGTTAVGPSVLHHFDYPGKYVVVTSISQDTESVSDRIIVTAEPAQLGFFVEQDGSVRIENKAGRDLDLSKWVIRAFFREFLLPNDSIILAGSSMHISSKTIGFFAGPETELAYPNGALALRSNQASKTEAALPELSAPAPMVRAQTPVSSKKTPVVIEDVEEKIDPVFEPTATSQVAAAAALSHGGYWWLGVLVLAGITSAGAIVVRRMRGREWDVIEDSQ